MNRFLIFLKGMAMGAADVVPGVSGGTIAFISGIYEELIDSLRSINLTAVKLLFTGKIREFWAKVNGIFLLPLFVGIGVSILSLAKLIGYLLENQPILLWSFFFGLIIASVIFIARQIPKWTIGVILALLIGTIIAYWITIASPSQIPEGNGYLFLAGAIAICAMILPGVSGSFILLLMGAYSSVLGAVNGLSAGEEAGGFVPNAIKLLFFMLGCFVGLLSFSHFLSWLFKRAKTLTMAVLTGFMLGSLNKVWPWKETISSRVNSHGEEVPFLQENILPNQFEILNSVSAQLGGAILCCLIGFAIVFILEAIGEKEHEAGIVLETRNPIIQIIKINSMTTKDKYQEVLNLGQEFGIKDGYVNEEGSTLKIGGVATTQYEKDRMWDKIKEIGGEQPMDIVADISVETHAFYHKHTVASGESLSKIAKKYFGDPMKYKQIFEANTNILKNPDMIHPGQELVIPNL